jgi:acyl-coenzyme A thioesterase PaaI-like protein
MLDPIPARRDAVAALGSAVRAALVAIAATEAPIENLQRAAALADQLTAELTGTERPLTQVPSVDDLAHGIRYLSPTIGLGNPMSPPVVMARTATGVETHVTLDRRFEGPPGFVHGGVTALLLDEVLGEAATHVGLWGLTGFLNIDYLHALPIDVELVATAQVSRTEGRKTFVSGGIALSSDPTTPFVAAEALFVTPRAERYDRYFDEVSDANGPIADITFGAPDRAARGAG